jgi:MoaA/NifB/PqqE/SkfB family radical SAM enzyme
MFEGVKLFSVDIHATGCTNRCQHCWTQGSPKNKRVAAEQVLFVLDKLAELKKHVEHIGFFIYDEPTTHPQFVEMYERAAELGLMWEGVFLATNGSILAKAPDAVWQRLKNTGISNLQFTVYGLEQTHDAFARRPGAFRNVVTAIQRAVEHGMEWNAGIVLHADDADEIEETVSYLKGLHPSGEALVGWYPFSWQGRGRDAKRVRGEAFNRLLERTGKQRGSLLEEREAVTKITDSADLADRRAVDRVCAMLGFQLDRDLRLLCGGACDSAGLVGAAPELADQFLLGKLGDEGFVPLLEAYMQSPPPGIAVLEQVTWGELAERYGDRANDEVYWLNDLPTHKWAAAYLRDRMT